MARINPIIYGVMNRPMNSLKYYDVIKIKIDCDKKHKSVICRCSKLALDIQIYFVLTRNVRTALKKKTKVVILQKKPLNSTFVVNQFHISERN